MNQYLERIVWDEEHAISNEKILNFDLKSQEDSFESHLGRLVEKEIFNRYSQNLATGSVLLNASIKLIAEKLHQMGIKVDWENVPSGTLGWMPDITDVANREFGEVKPANTTGIWKGRRDYLSKQNIFRQLGIPFKLIPKDSPFICGLINFGLFKIKYGCLEDGLIVYGMNGQAKSFGPTPL